jgi:hypothetical protein
MLRVDPKSASEMKQRKAKLHEVAEEQKNLELGQARQTLRALCDGLTARSATFDYWVEIGPLTRKQVDMARAKVLYLSSLEKEGLCISCHMATTREAADAEKADAEQADEEQADAEQADAAQADAAQADAEQADAEQADAEKLHGSHTISRWYLERVLKPLGQKGDLRMPPFALSNAINDSGTTTGQTVGAMKRQLQCLTCERRQAAIERLDDTCVKNMADNAYKRGWTAPDAARSDVGNLYGFLLVNVMRSLAVRLVESAKYWPYFDALRLKTLLVTKRLTPPDGARVPELFLYCIPWCQEVVIPVTRTEDSKALERLAVILSTWNAQIDCSYGTNGTEFLWMVLTPMLVLVSLAEITDLAVCKVSENTTKLVGLGDAEACRLAGVIVFHVANVFLHKLDKLVLTLNTQEEGQVDLLENWKERGFATLWQAHGVVWETAAARDLFARVFDDEGATDEKKKAVIAVRQMAAGYNALRQFNNTLRQVEDERVEIMDSKGYLADGALIAFAEAISPNVAATAMNEAGNQAFDTAEQLDQDRNWLEDVIKYFGPFCPVVVRLHEVCSAFLTLPEPKAKSG